MNISGIKGCYGCGVCAVACKKRIIDLEYDAEGFYFPVIKDVSKCVHCGLCYDVCSFKSDTISSPRDYCHSFAGWSNDRSIRHLSSSGGVAYEIGKFLIGRGYKVCGVRYSPVKNRTEHFIAHDVDSLRQTIGSKYLQSYTVEAFRSIDLKDRYLVIGTPCQIDSFSMYIKLFHKENNFILIDFFCHGVPSKLLWDLYLKGKMKREDSVMFVQWREKSKGWRNSYSLVIQTTNGCDVRRSESNFMQGDDFFRLFFSDDCLGKACYDRCKFRYNRSSADIRIGDLWGVEMPDSEDGVSAVASFSTIGDDILEKIDCQLIPMPFEKMAAGQMKNSPSKSWNRMLLMGLLKLQHIPISWVSFESRIMSMIKRKLKDKK